jgi:hypothetical protein
MKNYPALLGILALLVVSWLPPVRRFEVEHTYASMYTWAGAAVLFFAYGLWVSNARLRYVTLALVGLVGMAGVIGLFGVVFVWATKG